MARIRSLAVLGALAILLAACGGSGGQVAPPTSTQAPTTTPLPAPTETPAPPPLSLPQASPAPEIALPSGFTAYAVAQGLNLPTSLALSPDGAVYVSQFGGPIFRLEDSDGDGVFDRKIEYVAGLFFVNGIAFAPQGPLFVSSRGRVSIVRDTNGDMLGDETEDIITDLPNAAHQNNGIAFGPDGRLYVTNGSTCNECDEEDERSATILQADLDGSDLRVYATGLRNPYDLTFDPQGRLWATDNGSDPPCNTIDELNLIEDGRDYGWPYSRECDSLQSGTSPSASLGFNTGSTGIAYYGGDQFPAEYQGNLFITLWGSNVEAPRRAGRVLVRAIVDETPGGLEVTVAEFATGFEHPIDVVADVDGTLLVLDFTAGKLYRIVYTGG
jgi:glucose/arabinose dehydrogenase